MTSWGKVLKSSLQCSCCFNIYQSCQETFAKFHYKGLLLIESLLSVLALSQLRIYYDTMLNGHLNTVSWRETVKLRNGEGSLTALACTPHAVSLCRVSNENYLVEDKLSCVYIIMTLPSSTKLLTADISGKFTNIFTNFDFLNFEPPL